MTLADDLIAEISFKNMTAAQVGKVKGIISMLCESDTFSSLAGKYLSKITLTDILFSFTTKQDSFFIYERPISEFLVRTPHVYINPNNENRAYLGLNGEVSGYSLTHIIAHEMLHVFGIRDKVHNGGDIDNLGTGNGFDLMGNTVRITNSVLAEIETLDDIPRGAYTGVGSFGVDRINFSKEVFEFELREFLRLNAGQGGGYVPPPSEFDFAIFVPLDSTQISTTGRGNQSDYIVTDNQSVTVQADIGNDLITTGLGDDTVYGGGDNDFISSSAGLDNIYGGSGDDMMFSSHGSDTVWGGDGFDTITGGGSSDILYGEGQGDIIHGGSNSDTLFGGNDWDHLQGDSGSDVIYGGIGADQIYGGHGSDMLFGGTGADTFHFGKSAAGSRDTIADFLVGIDKIAIDDGAVEVKGYKSGGQSSLLVEMDDGSEILIIGIKYSINFDFDVLYEDMWSPPFFS
ncbi:Hemolysin-type calcium-binding repeat-containing protein [Gemmobacter aquatilis]|uniref:Hemolysin-type calcium-binding repeat-containing protein n=1 Tax=Gemmobacter aquatilis TaxID=933059 RepID=A0A1H8CIB3_9RHOB|nr:calcium-binding protein [Gemmobacter aquatilis]SEM94785.1 Hemolysin-type calcium-binding repeat-containing protein [Gemmobacter aquatilis]